jgi:hypothetical protein
MVVDAVNLPFWTIVYFGHLALAVATARQVALGSGREARLTMFAVSAWTGCSTS